MATCCAELLSKLFTDALREDVRLYTYVGMRVHDLVAKQGVWEVCL